MRLITQPGGQVYVTDAPNWIDNDRTSLQIGITTAHLKRGFEQSQSFWLAQLYGVVSTGLIRSQFVFKGLKRDMLVNGEREAAKHKLAFTWAAARDAALEGDRFNLHIAYCNAPENRVFAVYVSPNRMKQEFPAVSGWAEHWAWIAADPDKPGSPIDWATRYDSCVWSS